MLSGNGIAKLIINRGGTFTDVMSFCCLPDGTELVCQSSWTERRSTASSLSRCPHRRDDSIRRLLEEHDSTWSSQTTTIILATLLAYHYWQVKLNWKHIFVWEPLSPPYQRSIYWNERELDSHIWLCWSRLSRLLRFIVRNASFFFSIVLLRRRRFSKSHERLNSLDNHN